MAGVLEGGCLCEAIRYRITMVPIDAGYCHCRLCQRSTGAPAPAWLTVDAAGFAYANGDPTIYHSSSHSQREFCGSCGTQLVFRKSKSPTTVDVTLASLDDPSRVEPQYHIWCRSRIAWFDTADSLPRYDDAGPDRLES